MADAELAASMEAAVTLTPAATSNGTEHPEASSTTVDNDTEMVDQVDDNNDDTMEDEEQRGEKRKRSLSPSRLDKLAKARSMRKFSKSKRKRAPPAPKKDSALNADATATTDKSTKPPPAKRVAALKKDAPRRRSIRELRGLGVDMDDGTAKPDVTEEEAKPLPYWIPPHFQGLPNRPQIRDVKTTKWRYLRPCKVLLPNTPGKRVNGFDTIDVLVSNPGDEERFEPAMVLDQREDKDGTAYLMIAYWWTRSAVAKALAGFKKYLDRKWPKDQPWQWMLGMYFDVISADKVGDKIKMDEKFCQTLFFGHIPYNFEIFDKEATDPEARKDYFKAKIGNEADRDEMEKTMRKLWSLFGPAFLEVGSDYEEDDEAFNERVNKKVAARAAEREADEAEAEAEAQVDGNTEDAEGAMAVDKAPDSGVSTSDKESTPAKSPSLPPKQQTKSKKQTSIPASATVASIETSKTDDSASEKEQSPEIPQHTPPSSSLELPPVDILMDTTIAKTATAGTRAKKSTKVTKTSATSSTKDVPATAALPKDSPPPPGFSEDNLSAESKEKITAVINSIKRLINHRSITDQWCTFEMNAEEFAYLEQLMSRDETVEEKRKEEVLMYNYFPSIEEFYGRVVGHV